MTMIQSTNLRSIAITVVFVLSAQVCPQCQGITIDDLNRQSIVIVEVFGRSGSMSQGTGLLLYDYLHDDSVYLLTARHVLEKGYRTKLFIGDRETGLQPILQDHLLLEDSLSNKLYKTYTTSDGQVADIALLSLEKKPLIPKLEGFKVLSRSACAFDDSVYVGDHVLVFGFADYKIFDFVVKGDPLAVSAVIAHKGTQSYLIDTKIHEGMSGGIAFKEYPGLGQNTYKAVGLVSSHMLKYEDYSWVVKLDYIDSILVSQTGSEWGKD